MLDAEKAVLKATLKAIVDSELPAIVAAEEQRLPALYQPLVGAVVAATLPQLIAILDAKIAAM